MWKQHLFSLICRAIANTLTVGGSTLAGVIVVGVIGIFLGFIVTLLIEGFRSKWNSEVMKAALRSWPPYVGAMGGVLIAWMFLFAWSIGATVYRDHISLASENVALKGRVCPALNTQLDADHGKEKPTVPTPAKDINQRIKQSGKGNIANPGAIQGPITQGPCGVVQNGGSNNTAAPNCGPPPLVLDVTSVETNSTKTFSYRDKEGLQETEITIAPNQPVTAPFTIVLEFDNPISQIGHTVKNVGAQMGGGPFTVGKHARESVLTSISPSHPLVVVVFSLLPVKLVAPPSIEY
jgi:hypothetical protein